MRKETRMLYPSLDLAPTDYYVRSHLTSQEHQSFRLKTDSKETKTPLGILVGSRERCLAYFTTNIPLSSRHGVLRVVLLRAQCKFFRDVPHMLMILSRKAGAGSKAFRKISAIL
jgi:hypothetical protein